MERITPAESAYLRHIGALNETIRSLLFVIEWQTTGFPLKPSDESAIGNARTILHKPIAEIERDNA